MITRIEIDGFKSLRDVALDLEPLTAVIGPNGSGKSNFVEALRFLSQLADGRGVERALGAGRGTIDEQFSCAPDGSRAEAIRIAVELLVPVGTHDSFGKEREPRTARCRYEVEVGLAPRGDGAEVPVIRREALNPIEAEHDAWLQAHPDWAALCTRSRPCSLWEGTRWELQRRAGGYEYRVLDANVTSTHPIPGLRDNTPLVGLPAARFLDDVGELVEAVAASLRHIKVLHSEHPRLRASSDPKATPSLEEDGGNLPTAFNNLSRVAHVRVSAQLARLAPGLRKVETVLGSDGLLGLRLAYADENFPARLVSDGTLRLLALLVHVHSSEPAGVAVVEEPENGVHPESLRVLMESLRADTVPAESAAVPPQVILVSHSPALVAALQDQPQSLVFAETAQRGDGVRYTRLLHVRRADQAPDGGRTSVSPQRIRRLLASAASAEDA